jgi:hypothetical protein
LCFFLLPLGLLLLVSTPRTVPEWLWIGTAVVGAAIWRQQANDFAAHVTVGAALLFTGSFVIATLAGMAPLIHRILASAGATALGLTLWFRHSAVTYTTFRYTMFNDFWTAWREKMPTLPAVPPTVGDNFLAQGTSAPWSPQWLAEVGTTAARLYPADLTLAALASAWLAWVVYQRVAANPMGEHTSRFSAFTFNDHLIWVFLVSLGMVILDRPAGWVDLFANLLSVFVVLYILRGAAIVVATFARASMPQALLLIVAGMLLLPMTVSGCAVLGVADTWLDLRRRLVPEGAIL